LVPQFRSKLDLSWIHFGGDPGRESSPARPPGETAVKLYSGPLSLFSAKVRIALAEKGIACQLESVPWSPLHGYTPKHPEVVRINPKGQVPVLVDAGLELYDSTLILEYLEERQPTPPLLPKDPRERARCRQLELEADEVYFPHVWTLIRERFYPAASGGTGDAEALAAAERSIGAEHRRLEAALGEREYLCGDFSNADVAHFLVSSFAALLGAPISGDLRRLSAWFAGVAARPCVARDVAGMQEFLRRASAPPRQEAQLSS
jgi:glutathione S-transferase